MQHLRIELLVGVLACAQLVHAQPQWKASIPAVHQQGVHALRLTPELLGASATDLCDLRLFDGSGKEVPYLLQHAEEQHGVTFIPYPMVRNEVQAKRTVIELERPADRVLDMLHIRVRPVDVVKHVRVLGSDDRGQWYLVKDDHVVVQGARGDPPHQVLSITIPPSDYRWLQLVLNDSLTAPIQVLGVGHFTTGIPIIRFVASTPLKWEQQDSTRETRIRFHAGRSIVVDRLRFIVADTGYFHRSAQIRAWRTRIAGRGRRKQLIREEVTMGVFVISSDLAPVVDIPTAVLDSFDLVIDNGNDLPLHFEHWNALAREHLLIAQLSPGTTYHLVTGDPSATLPRYDMAHFVDQLPAPLDTLAHGTLMPNITHTIAPPLFDPSSWWMWGVLLTLMVGMGAMALRMMRKID